MSKSVIYGIFISGRIVYVGKTKNLSKRAYGHLVKAFEGNGYSKTNLYKVLNRCISYGVIPKFKILSIVDDAYACKEESKLIAMLSDKLVCNIYKGGKRYSVTTYPYRFKIIKQRKRKAIVNVITKSVGSQLFYAGLKNKKQEAYAGYEKTCDVLNTHERECLMPYFSVWGGQKIIKNKMTVSLQTVKKAAEGQIVNANTLSAIRTFLSQTSKKVA